MAEKLRPTSPMLQQMLKYLERLQIEEPFLFAELCGIATKFKTSEFPRSHYTDAVINCIERNGFAHCCGAGHLTLLASLVALILYYWKDAFGEMEEELLTLQANAKS